MERIFFDENAGDARGRYDLGVAGARRDIERAAGTLNDGQQVLLYDGEDIEVVAVVEFDRTSNRWMASPLWDTVRRLGEEANLRGAAE